MSREENIQKELIEKLGLPRERVRIQRPRRLIADADSADFRKIFDHAVKNMAFCVLCAITGLDEGQRLSFIYHLAREDGIMLGLKTYAPKEAPAIKTITGYFPAADIYERELADLLGAHVEGLAPGNRYPLSDDWPRDEHPLRKDWPRSENAAHS